ncbi:hypothetical protein GZ77_20795 [Endozoicomonas montiporae]|uniref:CCA-adding enzyme n=2 Tax=Endozoicomonas montiporae TaxID=1027273 RepID=A0A081N357_9GAMM|nr:CCA tRNA nucleotidyltransferase [Endozoicomonas montiporae]AMO58174.1 multifunctional tRNA nucleotidyl transferase/2'3'-cyclic phosphodiesterase/2'nucleotidase/phosphatase [Endozoicomonas montiporae CL-33]KEQ12880.1 hypothetical protein GZ77_20795 [Endozoicomonas montiporae]
MMIYLVGGAVRDKLLGLPVKDRDWVVVNSTPDEMLQRGFQPVGQDFPVFLHPDTKEEYALARTERKSGHGYAGFTFHTDQNVTLEQDLIRRDLTINAMAESPEGEIIDPYQGQQDLEQRLLRHVSPAFQEDPLRILRVARFAARFANLGFTIADDTMALMAHMVSEGEASYLVPERVWQETARALMEQRPEIYFLTLMSCNALNAVLQEWQPFLMGSPHCLAALQRAAEHNASETVRFACLFAPNSQTEENSLKRFFKRMRFPSSHSELALLVYQQADNVPGILDKPDTEAIMGLFETTDALRRPDRFREFIAAAGYIAQAKGLNAPASSQNRLFDLLKQCQAINAREIVAQGIKGKAVGEKLRKLRLEALEQALSR